MQRWPVAASKHIRTGTSTCRSIPVASISRAAPSFQRQLIRCSNGIEVRMSMSEVSITDSLSDHEREVPLPAVASGSRGAGPYKNFWLLVGFFSSINFRGSLNSENRIKKGSPEDLMAWFRNNVDQKFSGL